MASDGRALLSGQNDQSNAPYSPDLADATRPAPHGLLHNRPGYKRLSSTADTEGKLGTEHGQHDEGEDIVNELPRRGTGDLGFDFDLDPEATTSGRKARRVIIKNIARVPVPGAFKSPLSTPGLKTPGSADSLVGSPDNFARIPGFDPTYNTSYEGFSSTYDHAGAQGISRGSPSSIRSPEPQHFRFDQPNASSRKSKAFSIQSAKSAYETDFQPQHDCRTHESFFQGRTHWLSVTILILAVFSTIFSGIYVVIALKGFRYGKAIRSNGGKLSYSNASLLTALFAKLIELSFTTVFVAFLGQVLSRRAFMKRGKGVTLAEMNMRNWIMQPGTMITHYETIQYAALSFLGAIALTAAVMGMLYTTAADALVSPQLKFGGWENKYMQSFVAASYANVDYLKGKCATPVHTDPEAGGDTCLQIEHASQGYHNYEKYMTEWSRLADNGNGTRDQKSRPPGFALLNENITVTAKWINVIDMAETSARFGGRVINNVTLAMPHSGVWKAARDPRNDIVQPEDLDGLGIYNIRASVPSPVITVLCANLDKSELAPLIYTQWPEAKKRPFNSSTLADWPARYDFARLNNFSITTKVDDVFEWGSKYGPYAHPPAFPRYPAPFNTILNHTFDYGRSSVYVLGLPSPAQSLNYTLCQLKTTLSPNCSTSYIAGGGSKISQTGGHLESNCEDPKDTMAYIRSVWNATESMGMQPDRDWPWVASEALGSLSLNAGYSDGNASNARLLTQFFLTSPSLSPSLPSPAEALAVMAGCTLLMSAMDSPFVMFWNYTRPALEAPQTQWFNASVRAQEYASGGVYSYQYGFHVVLLLVFLTNVFILGYFLVHKGLVTDFSEPPNLFSLAVNSPPSHHLAGSCGAGPHGKQYQVGWRVNAEGDHLFMESKKELEDDTNNQQSWANTFRERISYKHANDGSDEEVELVDTNHNVGRIYDKLSKRRSVL